MFDLVTTHFLSGRGSTVILGMRAAWNMMSYIAVE